MSRLAKKPIPMPQGASIEIGKFEATIKGPKATLKVTALPLVHLEQTEEGIMVKLDSSSRTARTNAGTIWSLTKNAIEGVTTGFTKVLELEGVGYKVAKEGNVLVLSLGYVLPVRFEIPAGIEIAVEKNVMTVTGASKELVGLVASQIRSLKKPEPYKGKGIHYQGEVIPRKVGKKAATAGS